MRLCQRRRSVGSACVNKRGLGGVGVSRLAKPLIALDCGWGRDPLRTSGVQRNRTIGLQNAQRTHWLSAAKSVSLILPRLGKRMQTGRVKRREFITLIGGAAAWPLAARAQQRERMRRIGVLMSAAARTTDQQAGLAMFMQVLHQLGWTEDRNVQVEIRWGGGDAAKNRGSAEELVALSAEVIMVTGAAGLEALLRATRSVPIIFHSVADPVGSGFAESLARPGGNATGFTLFEYTLSGKWLELLKQIAPNVTRVAVLRDAALIAGVGQFAVIQSVAPSIGIEVSAINLRDASDIEQAVKRFSSSPNGGLIVTGSALSVIHHNLVIALAAQHKLPAGYYRRYFVTSGGLISYGPDVDEQYRGAARYVDRILKGDKPADLPVQVPTKYELIINLQTAKALGLEVPPTLLARADEVIE
jgi:putative ABC transport system substrate-binding protein